MEEYKDEDYFSMDTDEQVDRLVAFSYAGTTAMKHSVLRGSRGSGSSQSSGETRSPRVDLTGEPSEQREREPAVDLDKTIEMRDEMQVAVDASEQETPQTGEGPERPVSDASTSSKKKKKSKQMRAVKRAEDVVRRAFYLGKPGGKEATLQGELANI